MKNIYGIGFVSVFMMVVFSALSQFERETLLQRQREGIECAKKAGRYKGRKPIDRPDNWDEVIALWKADEITAVVAQKKLGMTPATFYRKVKELA